MAPAWVSASRHGPTLKPHNCFRWLDFGPPTWNLGANPCEGPAAFPSGIGLLQPNVNSRRTACSHPGIRVTENGQVGFAVTVKIADIHAVLVVNAIFERNPLHAISAQPTLVTEEHEHLIG